MTPLIRLHRVCIDYPVHHARFSKAEDGFTQKLGGQLFVRDGRQYVRALDRVTLRVGQGTRLGLIGANGSGKSTLLRTMAGILPIASGIRRLEGKMVTLFSTTAGMDVARTGVENIWRLTAIHNVPALQVPAMIDDIAEFTELGRFIHMPVKTYSAGMRARLGFAIATSIKSDIVLIDEVIGAGDSSFYEKARDRLDAFMSGSGIVVVASHSMSILQALCRKGVVVRKGRIVYEGTITKAAKFYSDAYGTAIVDAAKQNNAS